MSETSKSPSNVSRPLVSIVIDNYNYGRFLREAIDSALLQTYPNIEVIVVDDGSTDDSRSIIESFGDRIKPVLKTNGGQASAFNEGYLHAKGEFVAYLDSDDVYLPEKIAKNVEAALAHPNAQFIYNRVQYIDAVGNSSGNPYPKRLLNGDISQRVRKGGGTWQYAPTSGQLIRRTFLERIMPIPLELYRTSADAYISCLAGMLVEVVGQPEALTKYRVHGANAWMASNTGDEEKNLRHRVHRFSIECDGLNEALQRLGSNQRVSTSDNFVYQLNMYQLGIGSSIPKLTWLMFRGDLSEQWLRAKILICTIPQIIRAKRGKRRAEKLTSPSAPDVNAGAPR